MRTTYITFRGEEDVAILYQDFGYEPDDEVNNIDWHFVDKNKNLLVLSYEEEEEIYQYILSLR